MFIVDDPMLALIMRFISRGDSFDVRNEEFMKRQVAAVGKYVAQFPPEEKTKRGMEWIEKHAERYRKAWQRSMAAKQLSDKRCPDCPLIGDGSDCQCEIHQRWQELLRRYANDEIDSERYVENALRLLEGHKTQLKVAQNIEFKGEGLLHADIDGTK